MKLETGKYYRTRAGKKAYVSAVHLPNPFPGRDNETGKRDFTMFPRGCSEQDEVVQIKEFPELKIEVEGYPTAYYYMQTSELPHHLYSCNLDGRRFNKIDSPYDIVGEWSDDES